jgi:predicted nucleic acid-binding protein
MRIRLETDAVELVLAHVRQKRLEMIVSTAHEAEIDAIGDVEERHHLVLLMGEFGTRFDFDFKSARKRASELVSLGLGIADAAHLAFAEQAQADFVTTDDRLAKHCRRANSLVWVGSPLAYCEKESLK